MERSSYLLHKILKKEAAVAMTYNEALNEQKQMVEFRDKHYANIHKARESSEKKESEEFHFSET